MGRQLTVVFSVVLPAALVLAAASLLVGGSEESSEALRPDVADSREGGRESSPAVSREDSQPAAKPPVRPGIVVESAILTPAGTPSGQARQRARLSVRVRIRNRADERVTLSGAVLVVGETEVRSDPNASEAAGPLLRPLPPRARVTGELRFETEGAVTEELQRVSAARLRYSGRTSPLRITIGPPADPQS